MSKKCDVTGSRPGVGNNLPWSKHKTRRRWEPNLQNRRYYLASEGRWIRLRISAKGIKIIDRRGIDKVVANLRKKGFKP